VLTIILLETIAVHWYHRVILKKKTPVIIQNSKLSKPQNICLHSVAHPAIYLMSQMKTESIAEYQPGVSNQIHSHKLG